MERSIAAVRLPRLPGNRTARRILKGLGATAALALLAGCARPPGAARAVWVDLARVETAHPGWRLLADMDRELAELQRADGLAAPSADLPEEEPGSDARFDPAPAPDTTAAEERARRVLERDRQLAEAVAREQAQDDYLADLRRLQSELRAIRERGVEVDLREYQAAVVRAGEQIARLTSQLHSLRPSPATDPFYYTPEQLARRAELFERTRRELEQLRADQLAELRTLLTPPETVPAELSKESTVDLERQRDAAYARAAADLARREAQATREFPRLEGWAGRPAPGALALAPAEGPRGRAAAAAGQAGTALRRERAGWRARRQAAFRRLREQRRVLARRIAEETAAVCQNLAAQQGVRLAAKRTRALRDETRPFERLARQYWQRLPGGF